MTLRCGTSQHRQTTAFVIVLNPISKKKKKKMQTLTFFSYSIIKVFSSKEIMKQVICP